jgi:Tfp pilus assembly protein PilF
VEARYQDLNRLAQLLAESRDLDAAAEQYLFLLRYAPDSAELHNNYGNILLEQRKPDQAISEYNEAIRLDPSIPSAHSNIGICLAMKNLDRAIGE